MRRILLSHYIEDAVFTSESLWSLKGYHRGDRLVIWMWLVTQNVELVAMAK